MNQIDEITTFLFEYYQIQIMETEASMPDLILLDYNSMIIILTK